MFKKNQGIVPIFFRPQKLIHPFVVCKFPGNRKFYMNEMPKYVSNPPQLFILTVDISRSVTEIKENVTFWMSQIKKNYSPHSAHIIVIGSHPDNMDPTILRRELDPVLSLLESCSFLPVRLHEISSHQYQLLVLCLSQCIASERSKTNIAYSITSLSSLIDELFGSSEIVDLMEIISYIKSNDDVPLPTSKEDLERLLSSLSRYRDLIHLSLPNGESWIIVNILKYLEMVLTRSRLPISPDLETLFLHHLGFYSDDRSSQSEEPKDSAGW